MNNEQIIIDGIDVSGCDKFEWSCLRDTCKEMHNCYYKKLKRKEQECEAKTLEIEGIKKQLDQLKAEKDKYYQQNLDDEIQINNLYQALQEIKEIAEAITNGTHFSDDIESHLKEMVKQIINKINEVEQ